MEFMTPFLEYIRPLGNEIFGFGSNAIDYLMRTPISAAFLGGAVAWGVISSIGKWWSRPIIRAELVRDAGCYVPTQHINQKTGEVHHEAKFLRLRIRNGGRSSIQDCSGFLTSIKKRRGGQLVNDERE